MSTYFYKQRRTLFKHEVIPLLYEPDLLSVVFIRSGGSTDTFQRSCDWIDAVPDFCIAEYFNGDIEQIDLQIVKKGEGLRDGIIYNPFVIEEYVKACKLMILNLTLQNWKNYLKYTEALRKNKQNSFDTLFLVKPKDVSEEVIKLFNADAVLFAEKPFRKKELIQQLFGDTTRKL